MWNLICILNRLNIVCFYSSLKCGEEWEERGERRREEWERLGREVQGKKRKGSRGKEREEVEERVDKMWKEMRVRKGGNEREKGRRRKSLSISNFYARDVFYTSILAGRIGCFEDVERADFVFVEYAFLFFFVLIGNLFWWHDKCLQFIKMPVLAIHFPLNVYSTDPSLYTKNFFKISKIKVTCENSKFIFYRELNNQSKAKEYFNT